MKQYEAMLKDYYHILGISSNASSRQIKSAYRHLAHRYHPDVPQTGSINRMTEINEAYEVLSDRLKRAIYDRLRERQRTLWEEEIRKATEDSFSFYNLEPFTVAVQETSKGRTKKQIVDTLVREGLAQHIAFEIVDEVFETKARLRRKVVMETTRFIFLILIIDALWTGIMHSINPAIDIYAYFILFLLFIGGLIFIFNIYKGILGRRII